MYPIENAYLGAEVLALALSEIVPNIFLVQGGDAPGGFYYDFISEPISEEMVCAIEERMVALAKEDIPCKIHEMVPSNAIEFFKHHKRIYPTYHLKESRKPLVKVLQIGSFIDLVKGELPQSSGALGSFKLTGIQQREGILFKGTPKRVFRIHGTFEKGDFLSHIELGRKWNLFHIETVRGKDYREQGRLTLLPEGEALLHCLKEMFREAAREMGAQMVQTFGTLPKVGHKKIFELKDQGNFFAECLNPERGEFFDPIWGLHHIDASHAFYLTRFCKEDEVDEAKKLFWETVERFLKRLEISYERVDDLHMKLINQWDARCKGPFLKVSKKGEDYTVEHHFFPSVEKGIALILENKEKDLSQKKELLRTIGHLRRIG